MTTELGVIGGDRAVCDRGRTVDPAAPVSCVAAKRTISELQRSAINNTATLSICALGRVAADRAVLNNHCSLVGDAAAAPGSDTNSKNMIVVEGAVSHCQHPRISDAASDVVGRIVTDIALSNR